MLFEICYKWKCFFLLGREEIKGYYGWNVILLFLIYENNREMWDMEDKVNFLLS